MILSSQFNAGIGKVSAQYSIMTLVSIKYPFFAIRYDSD